MATELCLSPPMPRSTSASPSSCCSFEPGLGFGSGSRSSKHDQIRFLVEKDRLLRALHDIADRYDEAFLRLRSAANDLAALRRENLDLTAQNLHLSLLLQDLEAKNVKQPIGSGGGHRDPVPKSISIRSKDFSEGGDAKALPQRLRVKAAPAIEEGGTEGEVEVEVYRQGMEKTELCNKWEQDGCPYGDKCRFAHGVQELRPVIRHPRYKTQLCRLFSASGNSRCPYGHRCHFRHTLPSSQSQK